VGPASCVPFCHYFLVRRVDKRKLHYYYRNDLIKQNESSLGIMKWDLKHE
jgi:hypothetical protein